MSETPKSESTSQNNEWKNDVLHRKEYAGFLTKYIEGKCTNDKPAIVVALDAPWGSGKTFFVQHWAEDLSNSKRPVIFFNAWENDSADDPTVAFMAELRNGLSPFRENLPLGQSARTVIEEKSKEAIGHLRRALIPVLGVAAKAVLKKTTGIATDEIIDAAIGHDESSMDASDAKELSTEILEKGLDKFFEKALDSHNNRLGSIRYFRQSLEELLALLIKSTDLQGPLYVFIDELDRCRPDYAIRLLEGVKHLFSVRGVAFVVSTNMSQLSKAVSAIYGSNFDGYGYLKRFFDIEFSLPEPSRLSFIELNSKNTVLEQVSGCSGLDPYATSRLETNKFSNIAYIAEAMQLDLRSIRNILSVTEAVVLGLPSNTKIASMWLFFVAATRHRHSTLFELISSPNRNSNDFKELCISVVPKDYTIPSYDRETEDRVDFSLVELLSFFHTISKEPTKETLSKFNKLSREDSYSFPNVLIRELIGFNGIAAKDLHPISQYPALVRLAGHISREAA
ncbi:KAP family P-loop NTPase fold protein [Hydrogenophaga luteola]|uniref:P-loop NTPase fold protein n=1 Tax=Hydrogenophaga luteola TaxID=1591122 RepID=A0ABV7W4Z2_9BURK